MIWIFDNALKNPYDVRTYALNNKHKFLPNDNGQWPGKRFYLDKNDLPFLQNKLLEDAKHFTRNPNLKQNEISFQYSTKDFFEGMFHWDEKMYTYIIFLTPEPPNNTGTEISYVDANKKFDWIDFLFADEIKFEFFKNTKNIISRLKYYFLLKKHNAAFYPTLNIKNKFNTGFIFDGNNYHRAQKFFGDSIYNSRLTLISFYS